MTARLYVGIVKSEAVVCLAVAVSAAAEDY